MIMAFDTQEPTETDPHGAAAEVVSEPGWQVTITHRQTGRPVTDAAEAHEAMVSLAQPQDEPIEQAFPGTNSWLVTLTLPAEQMAELEDGDELEMRSELYVLEVDWTRIYVTGFNEPIEVRPDDVVIPEEFGAIRSVIALDIQALLLFLPDEEEEDR